MQHIVNKEPADAKTGRPYADVGKPANNFRVM